MSLEAALLCALRDNAREDAKLPELQHHKDCPNYINEEHNKTLKAANDSQDCGLS